MAENSSQVRVSNGNWSWLSGRKSPGDDFDDVITRLREMAEQLEDADDVRVCARCGYVAEPGFENDEEDCPQCGHHWDV